MTLACAPNFRDIGGLSTRYGGIVRRGRIFRSEAVLEPTEEDIACLSALGVVLVCDLRGRDERAHQPNRWWASRGVEILEMDILADIRGGTHAWNLLRESPTEAGGRALMHAVYRDLPAAAAPHLGTIFKRIALGDTPLLIHCTAGKDRTGFMSAMILHVLGVPEADILVDYLASAGRINNAVIAATRRLAAQHLGPGVPEAAIAAITGVTPTYLAESFATVRASHGAVDLWLAEACGLDTALESAVRDRLID